MTGIGLRVRAAVAALTLAFNPHQRRDSHGRWVKMPDSELKQPRRAGREPEGMGSPRASDWMGDIRALSNGPLKPGDVPPGVRQRLEQLFTFEDPQSGFRTEVVGFAGSGGDFATLKTNIRILDGQGREVGRAERGISPDEKTGKPYVYHASFNLSSDAQGGGFSARWLRQMEDRYREAGIEKILVSTEKVGGYAWAKAGFDFIEAKGRKQVARRLAGKLRLKANQQGLPQRVITDAEELIRRAESRRRSEWPTPIEFAMVGWEPGATTWLGKQTMLGSTWGGVKEL